MKAKKLAFTESERNFINRIKKREKKIIAEYREHRNKVTEKNNNRIKE